MLDCRFVHLGISLAAKVLRAAAFARENAKSRDFPKNGTRFIGSRSKETLW
jgi:hypothetical protein